MNLNEVYFLPDGAMQDSRLVGDLSMLETEDVALLHGSSELQVPPYVEYTMQHSGSIPDPFTQDQQVAWNDASIRQPDQSATAAPTTLVYGQEVRGNAQSRSRSRVALVGPSTEDWQIHRPVIEQLYFAEDVGLKDVMEIMKERFGFVASEKMYKSRFTQWNLRKNYTKSEKKEIVETFKTVRVTGAPTPVPNIRGRKAKMDRIRRYCRQERILEEVVDLLPRSSTHMRKHVNVETPSHSGSKQHSQLRRSTNTLYAESKVGSGIAGGSSTTPSDPERPFSLTSELGRVEIVLINARMLISHALAIGPVLLLWRKRSCFWSINREGRFEDARDSRSGSALFQFFNHLVLGVKRIVWHGSDTGWSLIHSACGMFEGAVQKNPVTLFMLLLLAFSEEVWDHVPDLRARLWRYITKLTMLKLGCNSPFTVISYHLQEYSIFCAALRPAYRMMGISWMKSSFGDRISLNDLTTVPMEFDDDPRN